MARIFARLTTSLLTRRCVQGLGKTVQVIGFLSAVMGASSLSLIPIDIDDSVEQRKLGSHYTTSTSEHSGSRSMVLSFDLRRQERRVSSPVRRVLLTIGIEN